MVESRMGAVAWGPLAIAPFPIPAHQTGRADFRHPAFRLASPQGTRRPAAHCWCRAPTPRHDRRVGIRIRTFEACSGFTLLRPIGPPSSPRPPSSQATEVLSNPFRLYVYAFDWASNRVAGRAL